MLDKYGKIRMFLLENGFVPVTFANPDEETGYSYSRKYKSIVFNVGLDVGKFIAIFPDKEWNKANPYAKKDKVVTLDLLGKDSDVIIESIQNFVDTILKTSGV